MARPNRQHYGKRPATQYQLAAKCFTASSSPVAELGTTVLTDSPSLSLKSSTLEPYLSDESGSTEGDSDIENLLQDFQTLNVGTEGYDAKSEVRSSPDAKRRFLRDVGLNGCQRESPRIKQRRLKVAQLTRNKSRLEGSNHRSPDSKEESRGGFDHDTTTIAIQIKSSGSPRPRKNRSKAQATAPEAGIEDHIQSLLALCGSSSTHQKPTDFQAWSDSIATYFNINKIAEASYGEVFRLSIKESNASFATADESVIKLIALKPSVSAASAIKSKAQQARIELMSAPEDVASEVRLLKHMTHVPGFTNFRDVKVVRGRLPSQFCAAWRYFNKNVKKSEFPDPSRKTTYSEDQLWAVVEMQDAGKDLENVPAENVWMCWDAFWGVACALAKGEEWAGFEHRDLHLGNICVRWNDFATPKVEPDVVLDGVKIGFTGLETTLIDYTLSRAAMSCGRDKVPQDIAYFDLSKDPSIFQGDGTEDYQYDIYRHMRSVVLTGDPCALASPSRSSRASHSASRSTTSSTDSSSISDESASWSKSHPLTNLVWLHFVLHKLTESISWSSSMRRKKAATEAERKKRAVAMELESKLLRLQKLLDLESIKDSGLASAGELVAWAIGEGWLDLEDVVGSGGDEGVNDSDDTERKTTKNQCRKGANEA